MKEILKNAVVLKSVKYFLYLTLFFIFYWFILCPLIISVFKDSTNHSSQTKHYFWILALLLFLIFLAIILLVSILMLFERHEKPTEFYKVSQNSVHSMANSDIMVKDFELEPINIDDNEKNENCVNKSNTAEKIDQIFPRCSVRRPEKTKSLIITQEVTVQRPISSPLTPRELFFQDLINGANMSTSSVKFPVENVLTPTKDTDNSTAEFFIANIPEDKTCTTTVEMFIDNEECVAPQTIELSTHIND